MTSSSTFFALDIGTRSVIGLILQQTAEGYHIIDVETKEHEERSMLDGHIHNIPAVAKVITAVKERLEENHGPLTIASVAAAGRALKTKRREKSIDISTLPRLSKEDILHLELSAVQEAQHDLAQAFEEHQENYHCVGYSVMKRKLDDEELLNLEDHTGSTATVEIIATFLPKMVVDSLLTALKQADLELEALTLEPIAAINVLIPPSMRRLNVALVDIGAGTSDIAITNGGTVIGYGMVPLAGDEITEALSDSFLLDFPDAERLKRELSEHEHVQFEDILGMPNERSKEEVLEPIRNTISQLASEIASEIMTLNQQAPRAVMLVGGGSMTPELTVALAEALDLPKERVAIRGLDAIKSLSTVADSSQGPEMVTPAGIAIAAREYPIEYLSVVVNQLTVRLFDVKELNVGDALMATGLQLSKLYGRPGMAYVIQVNGQRITVPGTHGAPPSLLLNGSETTLSAPIQSGDVIQTTPGDDGSSPSVTVQDVCDPASGMTIFINGKPVTLEPSIWKNGEMVSIDTPVFDRDTIKTILPKTVEDALQLYEPNWLDLATSQYYVINDQPVFQEQLTITVNQKMASIQTAIKSGDTLEITPNNTFPLTVGEILNLNGWETEDTIQLFVNEEKVTLKKPAVAVKVNHSPVSLEEEVTDGARLTVEPIGEEAFTFQELFRTVDLHINPERGQKLILRKNGKDTELSTTLEENDTIEIRTE
ncbi:cell division FtsA domain-containing protein [Salsuginibacillus kocurii]|uniref:cell division FtsA domain-containing protein n=1 Tax=Salsuginibacillus kocurii TaxID=427078 RepID=UPI00036988A7|nr:cell division FtsA domain-containing protein [Salsuginibacillus kocurii]